MKLFNQWEQALFLKILAEHYQDLLRFFDHVTYLDIGYRIIANQVQPELAVRIHVRRKLPLAQLLPAQILPDQIAGFTVDVLQSNPVPHEAAAERDRHFDPVPGGVAIANQKLSGVGTLGTVVFDNRTHQPMGLSAHHVLVGAVGQSGDPVTQPASKESQETVGQVARWDKELDCAVFEFNHSRHISRTILGLAHSPTTIKEPLVGMSVTKSGRTTGVTYGIVDGVNPDGFTIIPDPNHPAPNTEISSPGDSGALWIEVTTGAALGLHVAGEQDPDPAAERAWAKRISKVMSALDVGLE